RAGHLVHRAPLGAARPRDPVEDHAPARVRRGALQGGQGRMAQPGVTDASIAGVAAAPRGRGRAALEAEGRTAVLLTGVGKRYDIVSAFAEHAFVIAADPSPLAPARYAAHVRAAPPRIDDAAYVPFLEELVERYDVR